MSHHDHNSERRSSGPAGVDVGCGIKRVVRGLAERFGVSRGTVIAGFVLGFVFVPVLTLLVFAAAWFWAGDPQRFETRVSGIADRVKRAYEWTFSSTAPEAADPVDVPPEPVPEFPELRRAFEELESRTATLESYVSSDEYRLHREFHNLDAKSGA